MPAIYSNSQVAGQQPSTHAIGNRPSLEFLNVPGPSFGTKVEQSPSDARTPQSSITFELCSSSSSDYSPAHFPVTAFSEWDVDSVCTEEDDGEDAQYISIMPDSPFYIPPPRRSPSSFKFVQVLPAREYVTLSNQSLVEDDSRILPHVFHRDIVDSEYASPYGALEDIHRERTAKWAYSVQLSDSLSDYEEDFSDEEDSDQEFEYSIPPTYVSFHSETTHHSCISGDTSPYIQSLHK